MNMKTSRYVLKGRFFRNSQRSFKKVEVILCVSVHIFYSSRTNKRITRRLLRINEFGLFFIQNKLINLKNINIIYLYEIIKID